jgi:hypothetical protein
MNSSRDALADQPWTDLKTVHEVEAWIDHYNQDLQRYVKNAEMFGQGVCFCLAHGGEIYLHSTEDAILLDVTPEARWAVPVIVAASGIEAPSSPVWALPADVLIQLLLGLSSLIASSRIIINHRYKITKY